MKIEAPDWLKHALDCGVVTELDANNAYSTVIGFKVYGWPRYNKPGEALIYQTVAADNLTQEWWILDNMDNHTPVNTLAQLVSAYTQAQGMERQMGYSSEVDPAWRKLVTGGSGVDI